MKRIVPIITIAIFTLISCNKSTEVNLQVNETMTPVLDVSPNAIGTMHNEALDYIFSNLSIDTKAEALDKTLCLQESMKLCDDYIVSKGGVACFSDESISTTFVTDEMRVEVEAWDYNKVYTSIPLKRKQYLEQLRTMKPASEAEALEIANSIRIKVQNDTFLSANEKESLMIAISTFEHSLAYWLESTQLQPVQLKGWFDRFEDWFDRNSGIIMADCVWAQQAFYATAACGNPAIWGAATIGGAAIGSLASVYL